MDPNAADPYRSPGARPPPITIDFRHFSAIWSWIILAAFASFLALISHRVDLTCERAGDGGGYCEARDVHIAWSNGPVRYDLATIKGATLDRGSKGASRVALVTTTGQAPLSTARESSDDEKLAMIAAVERFLATPSERRLEVSYGSTWSGNFGAIVIALPFWLIFALLSRRVRVVVDRGARQLRLIRSRFPLPAREEGFELPAVARAVVDKSSSGRSDTYRVILVLKNGDVVPLTGGFSSGSADKQRTADAINRALAEEG